MFQRLLTAICVISIGAFSAELSAQQVSNQAAAAQQQVPAGQAKANLKKIGFRLQEWKAIHSHSDQEAAETVAALKKVGCEVTTEQHGDHTDVKYRCPEWKSLSLATDQLVNQWSTWFAAKGMETVVMNPPANTQKATVKFRLAQPKTVHLHDLDAARKIVTTLKLIGCEVSSHDHNGHKDVTFSSPNWITIELPSDENAHVWQKWLNESGFETHHEH